MTLESIMPDDVLRLYEVHEWRNASAVLSAAQSSEWIELLDMLREFRLYKSEILTPGGGRSLISKRLDGAFYRRGWVEKAFRTSITVDNQTFNTPTHSVDCYKNKVALEIEWNNKDPFFDRDLNNFRLLFELRAISVGVIITKSMNLRPILEGLGKHVWDKYGTSTTWMDKLTPRIEGGGGGGCPVIVFGIGHSVYLEDV